LVVSLVMAPVPGHAERLPIRTYTTADGLPSTFIQCIKRDSRGFLWFCTRNGLSRFDGQRFVTYGVDDGLPTTTVNDLLEARDGTIWVATNGGGVCRFNPAASRFHDDTPAGSRLDQASKRLTGGDRLFTAHAVGATRASNRVNALFEDRAGYIWAATDAGVFRLLDQKNDPAFESVPLRPPIVPNSVVAITSVTGDAEGSVWIGTGLGLIRRLPDGRLLHYISMSDDMNRVRALLTDPAGLVWAATDGGILALRAVPAAEIPPGQAGSATQVLRPVVQHGMRGRVRLPANPGEAVRYTTADGLADNAVRSFHVTGDGRMWIGTSGGLTEFSGGTFRSYTKQHGLSYQRLESVSDDGEGNLWLGTFGSGVMKLMMNGFVTFDAADGLGDQRVHSIFADEAGRVLVVNGDWTLSRFDGAHFRSRRAIVPDGSHLRWASPHGFVDHTGRLWMFSNKGLFRYPEATSFETLGREPPETVFTRRDGLPADAVNRVFEDSRGDLWISVADSVTGLARWQRTTGTLHTYSDADGFSPPYSKVSYPSAFAEDHAGNVWIGFDAGGLVRYTGGTFASFDEGAGVPAGRIMALHVDRRGHLWVGGNEGGLGRLDDPAASPARFTSYTANDGLSSNNVRCITEDKWGRLYVGTGGGVDRLDPTSGRVKHFTTDEGLASDFLTAAFADVDGGLWFGTLNGVSRLVPAPDVSRPPPSIRISGLHFSDSEYPLPALGDGAISGIQLLASQNRVRIDFFGLSFAMGEALHYQFKLEGIDPDWRPPIDQRTVYYPNLPPGTYRFAVRAIRSDGESSRQPAIVAFTIRPPAWRQPWFVTLGALLLASLLYVAYRYRVAQLVEIERVRTRIATDLHDDIGSNLSQIAILSEVLLQDGAAKRPRTANALSLIMSASRESVDSLSDIVWAINPKRDSLRDLTQRMRRFASDTLTARNIDFTFSGPAQDDFRPGANLRQQIFLIFKESVTNLVRHSGCTRATIEFRRDGTWLVLRVSDDGRGLGPATWNGGNGLDTMRARARSIDADFDVTSEPGTGTTVCLRIPLRRRVWRSLP